MKKIAVNMMLGSTLVMCLSVVLLFMGVAVGVSENILAWLGGVAIIFAFAASLAGLAYFVITTIDD